MPSLRAGARGPRPGALNPDSLAFAMQQAAGLVAAVREGRALTEALESLWASRSDWTPGQRGAIQDLAYNCLRHYGRGDAWLKRLLAKPAPAPVHALLLVALDRLEAEPLAAYTVVNQAVEAAGVVAPGLKALVNGVLRNVLRAAPEESPQGVEAIHCHPAWWVSRLKKDHPADWEAILAAGNSHPPMALRVNTRCQRPEAVLEALRREEHDARLLGPEGLLLTRPVAVARLPGFAEGWISVQDLGAQRCAHWLDLAPGQRVLDACAAPGGKAAHILEQADVSLLALEKDAQRSRRISENFARLGLASEVRVADCADLPAWWDGRPFDRILADVPCSASGVARRHPDIKWLRRPGDIASFAAQQARIMDALWQVLAPGGKMLYVTCSVFAEENSLQVARFCGRHSDARRMELEGCLEQQLLPDETHDGFYYALLQKRV